MSTENEQNEPLGLLILSDEVKARIKKEEAYQNLRVWFKALGRGGSIFFKKSEWNSKTDIQIAVRLIKDETGKNYYANELADKRGWTLMRGAK